MKLIYVCSPLRAETPELKTRNRDYAISAVLLLTTIHKMNAIAPHLYYPQFLDDSVENDRALGLALGADLMKHCDSITVFTAFGITEGMANEIKLAVKLGKKVVYFNAK